MRDAGDGTLGYVPGPFAPVMPAFTPGAPTGGGKAPLQIKRTAAPVKRTSTYRPAAPVAPRVSNPAPRVGNTSTGAIAPVTQPPPPSAPSIEDFLAGDTTFKSQNDALSKAWADYQNQQKLQTDQYETGYKTNVEDLGKQKVLDEAALNDDYASRGLSASGLFAKAYTDFLNDYANKQKQLDTSRSDFLANLNTAGQNYKSDSDLQLERARQDAINRRAAQYGV